MKTQIYSIYDTASGTYQKPIFARTDGEIMREFQNICMDAEHPCGQHPEDYSLVRMGNFNDQNGQIVNEDNECLSTGLEMLALGKSQRLNKQQPDMFADLTGKLAEKVHQEIKGNNS